MIRCSLCVLIFTMLVGGTQAQQQVVYQEAPMLAERVQGGELPPVEERLPPAPMVVQVLERIGVYGGTWRRAMLGINDVSGYRRLLYEGLIRWNMEFTEVLPNLAHSWEISDDATEYTFYLREGIKWSDGKPWTSADILFYFEHIIGNSELYPGGYPDWLKANDVPVEVTAPDDYTVRFKFAAPYGIFLYFMATPNGREMVDFQAEYAKTLHTDFNEQADELARGEGFNTWNELFAAKILASSVRGSNPDLPTLTPWMLVTPSETRIVLERNPYYWKVDPEGKQLPYIDSLVVNVFDTGEAIVLRAANGEIDWQIRHLYLAVNKPVLYDNMERGNYRIFDVPRADMNEGIIGFNLNHRDPVKREIFSNRDFRIGLSYAINREEINDLLFLGLGEPWQSSPMPTDSPYYHERLAKQHTEYDVDLANEYLDGAGYAERDQAGYRLGPDGNRIGFNIEVPLGYRDSIIDLVDLVAGYWQEVGVEAHVRVVERSLMATRQNNGEIDVSAHGGEGGVGTEVLLYPRFYFPFNSTSWWAPAWAAWYVNPAGGGLVQPEEPPAEVKRQLELFNQLKASSDPAVHMQLMQQILDIAAEQFYVIGTVSPGPWHGVAKNNFHNAPESILLTYMWMTPEPAYPEQFFIQD